MKAFFRRHLTVIVTLAAVVILIICDIPSLGEAWKQASSGISDGNFSASLLEDAHRDTFAFKKLFVDFYGLVQQALGKRVIGNFEFFKDDDDIVQYKDSDFDMSALPQGIAQMKWYSEKYDVPFVYIALPRRTDSFSIADSFDFTFYGGLSEDAKDLFADNGIDVIDVETYIAEDTEAPDKEQLFFKTDGHYTTVAEFYVARKLSEYLAQNYDIKFFDPETVWDIYNYTVNSYPFLGGLSRSSGKYLLGVDNFQIYRPTFETNLTKVNPFISDVKTGPFEYSLLNGYEENPHDLYTYWVTNFGFFTSPYYHFTNNLSAETDASLLIFCDSCFMRGFSYLSLASKKITVIDPRFFNGENYLCKTLAQEQFDAVIVVGTSEDFFRTVSSELSREYNAAILSHNTPDSMESGKSCNIEITVLNTGTYAWSAADSIRLCIWQDGSDAGNRVQLPEGVEVAPGAQYTFHYVLSAPFDKNVVTLEYQLVQEGIQYFGEKKQAVINLVGEQEYNAEILNTDTPMQIASDGKYDISITVKNTGTRAWSEQDMVRLCIWQDGVDYGYRVALPDGIIVAPGEEYTFQLMSFGAPPNRTSTFVAYQMVQEGIQYFGEKKRVDIHITGVAP